MGETVKSAALQVSQFYESPDENAWDDLEESPGEHRSKVMYQTSVDGYNLEWEERILNVPATSRESHPRLSDT